MESARLGRWTQWRQDAQTFEHASQLDHLALELGGTRSGMTIGVPSQTFLQLESAEFLDSNSLRKDAKDSLDHYLAHSAESLSHLTFTLGLAQSFDRPGPLHVACLSQHHWL